MALLIKLKSQLHVKSFYYFIITNEMIIIKCMPFLGSDVMPIETTDNST